MILNKLSWLDVNEIAEKVEQAILDYFERINKSKAEKKKKVIALLHEADFSRQVKVFVGTYVDEDFILEVLKELYKRYVDDSAIPMHVSRSTIYEVQKELLETAAEALEEKPVNQAQELKQSLKEFDERQHRQFLSLLAALCVACTVGIFLLMLIIVT